jgi:hypothetical protein
MKQDRRSDTRTIDELMPRGKVVVAFPPGQGTVIAEAMTPPERGAHVERDGRVREFKGIWADIPGHGIRFVEMK